MKQILELLEVKDMNELCSHVYNHGNNPYFSIYRKKDIRIIDCGKTTWEAQGGYKYKLCKDAKAIEDQSEDYHHICDSLGLDFYEMMHFASLLEDSFKFAQNGGVPFAR